MTNSPYVLVTPAKNEQEFIEKTIESVIAQSVKPSLWVIVSDGSTDRTEEIVDFYAQQHEFIQLLRRNSGEHCFGSKVQAFEAGCNAIGELPYEFIGNLDADIALPPDYYERLISEFNKDAELGLAGGTRCDLRQGVFVPIRFNSFDIGGAYQLFRRDCFDRIGGYLQMELGGEDTIACVSVRAHGWKAQAFQDLVAYHYRPTGAAQGNLIRTGYRTGKKRFQMGYHPLFEFVKLVRVRSLGEVLHNCFELCGFAISPLVGSPRRVPKETIDFLHAEQMARLRATIVGFRDPAAGCVSNCGTDREVFTHQEIN